jgi:hypothetical protein
VTTSRFPNVSRLVAQLPEGSLARTLCSCFIGSYEEPQIEAELRKELDAHRARIEAASKSKATP